MAFLPNATIASGSAPAASTGGTTTGALSFLPGANFGSVFSPARPVTPRATLQSVAVPTQVTQTTLHGLGQVIRVIYGRDRVGAYISNAITTAGVTYVVAVWAQGQCDAIESVTHGDEALPSGVTLTHYLGTTGQAVDASLVSAFAAAGIVWADALPGVCYTVLRFSSSVAVQWQALNAVIRGRLCYDPRTTATAWTETPSLCLADFLSDADYGAGLTVDYSTVGAVADANEAAMADGAAACAIGLSLDAPRPPKDWSDTLAEYAQCWVVPGADGLKLVPDGVRDADAAYSYAAGTLRSISNIRLRGLRDAPTSIAVRYTDTSALPYRERTVTVALPSYIGQARPSELQMPGFRSASRATRWATLRLNRLTTADLSMDVEVFDVGAAHEVGDRVDITHPHYGFDAKAMRVAGVVSTGPNTWRLSLVEYDPAAYSTAVVTEPTSPDTTLPSPADPQPVAGLALAEEVFQLENGTYSSRLRATWTADTQVRALYRFELRKSGGIVVSAGTIGAKATTWASPAVQEGVLHTLDLWTVGILGNESDPASASATPAGKGLVPGNVPSITVRELGGEVRGQAVAAVDVDIWRYEWRYVATGGTWPAGTVIDRIDSLRIVTRDVPAGDWDIMCKAIDSVGQYSGTEARAAVTVTLDDAALLLDAVELTTVALVNAVELVHPRGGTRRFVTSDGEPWNTKFSAAFNTYTNPILSYFSSAASSITLPSGGTGYDFGLSLAGNWIGEMTTAAMVGTVTEELGLDNGGGFTDYDPMSAKTTARYARLTASAAIGSAFVFTLSGATVQVSAVGRSYKGSDTSSAIAATAVSLASQVGEVAAFNGPPTIAPRGTTPCTYTVDNYVTGASPSFDVYFFDLAGTQIARDFDYAGEVV